MSHRLLDIGDTALRLFRLRLRVSYCAVEAVYVYCLLNRLPVTCVGAVYVYVRVHVYVHVYVHTHVPLAILVPWPF